MLRTLLKRTVLNNFGTFLLKNAKVVNADMSITSDVLLEGGKIAAVSPNLSHKTAQVIDCTGKLLIPGGIDTHAHMQMPFMGDITKDDYNLGSKAALAGGTTTFIDFALQKKGGSLMEAYDTWRGWADGKVNCDYGLHSVIIHWDDIETPKQMKKMVELGCSSFKFFMAYKGELKINDDAIMKAFEVARDLGALCMVHAENGDIVYHNQQKIIARGLTAPEFHYYARPESVEAEAVHRAITIAENVKVPLYIVHLMSKESSEEMMRAKNKGNFVYAETLAATIGTDGTKMWDKDWDVACRYVNSPTLSPDPKTKVQIMKYLNSGVIDVVATDNCTFCQNQKRLGRERFDKIPNGLNGLEDRLTIVWTKGVKEGMISENQFVELTSTKAAQIFNMYPNKGVIREGADADVVIWDPDFKKVISAATHHHNIDFNIFEGLQVYGRAVNTFSRGELVWDGQNFLNQHKGQFIKRGTHGFVYRRHAAWMTANDPINFKVDRSKPAETDEVAKLQS